MLRLKYFIPVTVILVLIIVSTCLAEAAGDVQNQTAGFSITGIVTAVFVLFALSAIAFLLLKQRSKQPLQITEQKSVKQEITTAEQLVKPDPSGEIHAAIAMALYLYRNELHDQENPVITMIRTSKTYSPWSSKIYHLRRLPR